MMKSDAVGRSGNFVARSCALIALLVFFLCACTSSRIDRAIAKADAVRGTQNFDTALQAYQAILIKFPEHAKDAEVWLRIGDLFHYNLHKEPEARQAYREVIARWPTSSAAQHAYERSAEVCETRADYPGAIEALEAIIRYFPAYPERENLRHRIGTLYLKQRQFAQARIEFDALLASELTPSSVRVETLFDMGEAFFLDHHWERAMHFYDQVIAEFPEHPLAGRALAQKAESLEEMGEMAQAQALRTSAGASGLQRLEGAGSGEEEGGEGARDAVQDGTTPSAPPWVINAELSIHSRSDIPAQPMATKSHAITITVSTSQKKRITIEAEIAQTEGERERGLQYRKSLPELHGMWFIFPQNTTASFWMKNTFVSLDLLFIAEDGTIVDIAPATKPLSETPITSHTPYRYVLEIPAGTVRKFLVEVGGKVTWE